MGSRLQHPLAVGDDRQKRPGPFVVPVVSSGVAGYLAEIGRSYRPQTMAKLRSALGSGLKLILQGRLINNV